MNRLVLSLFLTLYCTGVIADPSLLEKIDKYELTMRKPDAALEYASSGSPIPMINWLNNDLDAMKDKLEYEYRLLEFHNSNINSENMKLIRDGLTQNMAQKDVLNALVGYHDFVKPRSQLIRKKSTKLNGVYEYIFSGRYGQPLEAICGLDSQRSGLIVLLAGRGGNIRSMWGLGALDYSNNVAKKYFHGLKINVCTVRTYTLPNISFPRYGLSARGVDATQVIDFVEWALNERGVANKPLIVGGISNGSAIAEMVCLLDERIDVLLSIGGPARYDFALSPHSAIKLNSKNAKHLDGSYHGSELVLRSDRVFKLRAPKPLIVSIGTTDAGKTFAPP